MRKLGCLLVLVVALVIGLFVYRAVSQEALQGVPPAQHIDTVGVQTDLLGAARAERIYLVTHGRYGTLEELREDGAIAFGSNHRGYAYEAEVDGDRNFRITARPADPEKADWPTFSVDQTLQVIREP